MSQFFSLHVKNPKLRLIKQAVEIIQQGGVAIYPTDSCYAIGAGLGHKKASQLIHQIRALPEDHHMTLLIRDLSEIATYTKVDNDIFRVLKALTPASYTFLMKATNEVPRRLQHPKKRTIGIRIPNHPIPLALLEHLDAPMISTSLIMPNEKIPLNDPQLIKEKLGSRVDVILDGGIGGIEFTTVVNLCEDSPQLIRQGLGAWPI